MDFMDEYAEVMNKYTEVEVYNGFARGYTGLSITFSATWRQMLWLEDGVYCFDEEERGKVQKGGMFNSPSIELTQKVMLNYTVSILRHALGFEWLGLPMEEDQLPNGWQLQEAPIWRYVALDGPNGEHLDFETSGERGSIMCLLLSCCTRTCFPTAAHCFVGGWGDPMSDESLMCMSINEMREYLSLRK